MSLIERRPRSVMDTTESVSQSQSSTNIEPLTAENQTKGRGTMGKKWISQKGNLFKVV